MAIAGDVVIKLAADFAQFVSGMDSSIKKLEQFGEAAAKTNKNVDSFIGQVRGVAAAAVGLFAVDKIIAYVKETSKAAEEQEKLAKSLGFTADQIEAMQKNAKATGTTFEQQTKYFKDHRGELEKMTAAMKDQGEITNGELRTAWANINREFENTLRILGAVKAQSDGGQATSLLGTIAKMIRDAGSALAYFDAYKGSIASVRELMAIFTGAGGLVGVSAAERAAQHLQDLRIAAVDADVELQRAASALKRLQEQSSTAADPFKRQAENIQRGGGANAAQAVADAQANLEKAKAARDAANKSVADTEAAIKKAEETLKKAKEEPTKVIPTTPTGGGGGGKTDADNMEAQIARFRALGAAQLRVFEEVKKARGGLVEDVQRELRVQQQIEEISAKLGAKYSQASDAQKKLLHEEIELYERRKEAAAEYIRQLQAAEDINTRFGNAEALRLRRERELERAREGGADPQALERARKAKEQADRLAELQGKRYDEGLGSAKAGFEAAMEQYIQANDLFAAGGKTFMATMNSLGEVMDVLQGKSSKTFGAIAADFARMVQRIALEAAVSEGFKILKQLIIAGIGAASGSPSLDPSYTSPTYGGPRAAGGEVVPGQYYTVGEHGPETFVPQAVGRIEPYKSSGMGGDVTVNVEMRKAEGARDASSALEFGRRVKVAVQEVINNEKRPGGTLYAGA